MIDRIRQFFEQHIVAPEAVSEDELDHQLQLASAALMIEVLHADYSVNQEELDILRDTLQENFGISQDEALELIQLAKAERTEATDYYQFTSLINEYYTQQQKRDLVTHLWQMAYADRPFTSSKSTWSEDCRTCCMYRTRHLSRANTRRPALRSRPDWTSFPRNSRLADQARALPSMQSGVNNRTPQSRCK